jgi:processive 1,2-diacylglycerol beta-glucosyltransferase
MNGYCHFFEKVGAPMHVIFLSIAIGSGHHKAAEALQEVLLTKYPQARSSVVDTLKYINPVLDRMVVRGYVNTLKATPALFKKLYELTDESKDSAQIGKKFNRLLAFRIRKLIKDFKPDVIVCTHPFSLQMIHGLKMRGKIQIPLVGIITDYSIHGFWVERGIDAYVVATESMKQELVKSGVPKERIHPLGIPVQEKFCAPVDAQKFRKSLKLKEGKTALVMGGSLGLGEIKIW